MLLQFREPSQPCEFFSYECRAKSQTTDTNVTPFRRQVVRVFPLLAIDSRTALELRVGTRIRIITVHPRAKIFNVGPLWSYILRSNVYPVGGELECRSGNHAQLLCPTRFSPSASTKAAATKYLPGTKSSN